MSFTPNAKQRAKARRDIRRGNALIPADVVALLALAAEYEVMKAKVRRYIQEQENGLADLRVRVAYLVFDNECLRRENAELRARLGE